MDFRLQKAFRFLSGIKLNPSKGGLRANLDSKPDRTSVGLPGTGVSYQTTSSNGGRSKTSIFGIIVIVLAIGYAIINAFSDGKISIAHWQDLFTDQAARSDKDNQTTTKAEDVGDRPVHVRGSHHSVRKASDEN